MIKFKQDGFYKSSRREFTTSITRELDHEEYDRLKALGSGIKKEFADEIRFGYGLYSCRVYEKDGSCFISYSIGNSCD